MILLKAGKKEYLFNVFLFIFIIFISPLFFYKLGQSSLVSWDEAWHAEIARNIIKGGNIINLVWNSQPFFDHPPTGYWLMALTYKIFGINEFWTRFPSTVSAIISIILLYLLGKKLFNPLVGLSSAIALSSATWFVFRSRSGNLDIILTMFFLSSLLLAIFASENRKYFIPFAISLVFLFLTKTMVPLAAVPSLVLIFYKNRLYSLKDLIAFSLIFTIGALSWFLFQAIQYPNFMQNFWDVGLRGAKLQSDYLSNIKLAKDYLYNSIGRWFWPSIISTALSPFLKQKKFLILTLFLISFMLPSIFSPKIQIWHLIPLSPILILSFFGFTFSFLEMYLPKWKYHIFAVALFFCLFLYLNQVKTMWFQFINIPPFISDEAILSKEAGKYHYKLFVDGEYRPAALFYSEKEKIEQAPKRDTDFIEFFNNPENFLMITNTWRIEKLNISKEKFQILKKDRDKILILH